MKTPTQDLFTNAYLAAIQTGCSRAQAKEIACRTAYPHDWQHLLLEEQLDSKYHHCLHDLRAWQQFTLQLVKNHCPPHIVEGLSKSILADRRY